MAGNDLYEEEPRLILVFPTASRRFLAISRFWIDFSASFPVRINLRECTDRWWLHTTSRWLVPVSAHIKAIVTAYKQFSLLYITGLFDPVN